MFGGVFYVQHLLPLDGHIFREGHGQIAWGKTRLSSIKEADIIYVLQNGAITESGTHEQLLILKKEYFSLWNKQKTEEPLAENNTA